jgi:hypothetical protein
MMNCPRCEKGVYGCCSNKNCVCHKGISDDQVLIHCWMLFGHVIPSRAGDIIWKYFQANIRKTFLIEMQKCPHCGYVNTYGWWEDRSIKQYFADEGVDGFVNQKMR